MYKTKRQLVSWRKNEEFRPEIAKFDLENRLPCKPKSALWSSTFAKGSSGWVEWCLSEEPQWIGRFYIITPKPDAKVFVVRGKKDTERLPKKPNGDIDFQALAEAGWDGLRVVSSVVYNNWWNKRSRFQWLFYDWNCESTVWFNNKWIESVEEITLPDVERQKQERIEEELREINGDNEEDDDEIAL